MGTTKGIFFQDGTSSVYGTKLKYEEAGNKFFIEQIENGSQTGLFTMQRADGNVGIGTASPGSLLHVYGGNIKISSTDDKPQLVFGEAAADRWVIGNSNAPNNYFAIGEGSDIALNERLVIAPTTGSVGIGTTTPGAKLEVAGGIRLANNSDLDWGDAYRIIRFSTTGDNTLLLASPKHVEVQVDDNGATDGNFDVRGGSTTIGGGTLLMRVKGDGKVGIGSASPAAPLDVPRASDYKVTKFGGDVTSHYVLTGLADHTLTLTCASYFQAEIVITANQTNGGTYNNLYIRGIWSNNHTSHHWDEIENIGSLSGSTFTITVGQNGGTTNSGEWKIVHDYVSGSFAGMTVRVTDFYGNAHQYTIS
jgi:hypothetical protein